MAFLTDELVVGSRAAAVEVVGVVVVLPILEDEDLIRLELFGVVVAGLLLPLAVAGFVDGPLGPTGARFGSSALWNRLQKRGM